jgi:hypothetical protein
VFFAVSIAHWSLDTFLFIRYAGCNINFDERRYIMPLNYETILNTVTQEEGDYGLRVVDEKSTLTAR